MKLHLLIVASALTLAACGDNTAANNTMVTETDMTASNDTMMVDNSTDSMGNQVVAGNDTAAAAPMTAKQFADTAAASDAYELASSKLAQTKATAAGLKTFAAQMIKDHTASTAKLKTAAGTITPDPTMNAEQQANIAALEAATGAEFDAAYKNQQLAAHGKTLVALQSYATGGDNAALKTFAANTSPVVQGHLTMLQGM